MKTVPTFNAQIWLGFKERETGQVQGPHLAKSICQEFVDEVGRCVTVTSTDFIYTNGGEPGIVVGFINYPRFPATPEKIKEQALELANRLKAGYRQMKVTIVFTDETVMLEDDD